MNQSVDWEEQWVLFAENFYDGKAHIDLKRYGGDKTLLLLPGPGFGDLSHPTTQLMLEMMQDRVKGRSLLDVGSGSGILTLAAILLGAKEAHGVEIDPEAIVHAEKSRELNQLTTQVHFYLNAPPPDKKYDLALVNMIFPEQKIALNDNHRLAKEWISSGILATQKQEYLKMAKTWGWTPTEERIKGEWMGWVFTTHP